MRRWRGIPVGDAAKQHPGPKSTGAKCAVEGCAGRELFAHENVHHLNGQRADNRIDNLELWSKSQPPGQRVADKLSWAHEIIRLYQPLADADLI